MPSADFCSLAFTQPQPLQSILRPSVIPKRNASAPPSVMTLTTKFNNSEEVKEMKTLLNPLPQPLLRYWLHLVPQKTMVIGTIFGHRRGGHVWFCVHHDRLSIKPTLLLELSIPTTTLIQEMSCGLVRIALEFKDDSSESELSRCPLHSVPVWNLYCNGRKLGFALRRKVNQQNRLLFKTMQSITVGAGVIPSGFASGFGSGTEELMYMRANYECVIGSADSESFHLINPDEGLGQELSVFLLRTRS